MPTPLSYEDALVQHIARVSVNWPSVTQARSSAAHSIGGAHVSDVQDAIALIQNAAPNMFAASASGAALAALAADRGYTVSTGSPASGPLVFTLQTPAQATATILTGATASTVSTDPTMPAVVYATTAGASIPAGALSSGTPQQESVAITGAPTGGTLTLTHAGQTTTALAYNATAATVQAALQALSSVGTNSVTGAPNVSVTGGPLPGAALTVAWVGLLQGQTFAALTAASSLTGGTTPAVSTAITAPVAGVTAIATTNTAAGNVAAGTVTQPVSVSSQYGVTNIAAMTGGADPDTDVAIRAALNKTLYPKYSAAAVTAAILALAPQGVYDAYVLDPQNGAGTITYYWADINGNTPGLAGTNMTAGTLAATVDAAVRAVLPPNITPTPAAFTIQQVTNITASYSALATAQTTTIAPAIQTALAAAIQALTHGQTPTQFTLTQALAAAPAVGPYLTNFSLTSITPNATASATTLYRLTGSPASLISLTRV